MNIELKQLTDSSWEGLDPLLEQYVELFPEVERVELSTMKSLIDNQKGCFEVIYADNVVSGFAHHWDLGGARYLLYLMVSKEFQSQNIGSQVIAKLLARYDTPWLLETEPANSEINSRRIGLYERRGFQVVAKNPKVIYDGRGRDCPLWVMSTHSDVESYFKKIVDAVIKIVLDEQDYKSK